MKNCVVTASYSCPPQKVWLYLTNPNLNHWRTDLSGAEVASDGSSITEHTKDGGVIEVKVLESEKARRLRCSFTHGRVHGTFIAILLGAATRPAWNAPWKWRGWACSPNPARA